MFYSYYGYIGISLSLSYNWKLKKIYFEACLLLKTEFKADVCNSDNKPS